MERDEIPLPCPHCGGVARRWPYQHDARRFSWGCADAACGFTYVEGEPDGEAAALAAWNRRALTAENARLRDLLQEARFLADEYAPTSASAAFGRKLDAALRAAYRFALALAGYKLANPNVKIRVVRAPKKRKVKP